MNPILICCRHVSSRGLFPLCIVIIGGHGFGLLAPLRGLAAKAFGSDSGDAECQESVLPVVVAGLVEWPVGEVLLVPVGERPVDPCRHLLKLGDVKAREGKIRHAGVSNFTLAQIERVQRIHPVASVQPPYNMLARSVEVELLPFCAANAKPACTG